MHLSNKTNWDLFKAMPMLHSSMGEYARNTDLILKSMLYHEIAMSRGERSVCYFLSRLPNFKLTVHYATLRSRAKTFITSLNRYSLSNQLSKNAA